MGASGRAHPTARECETKRWACPSEDDPRGPDAVGVRRLGHRQPGKSPGSVSNAHGRGLSGWRRARPGGGRTRRVGPKWRRARRLRPTGGGAPAKPKVKGRGARRAKESRTNHVDVEPDVWSRLAAILHPLAPVWSGHSFGSADQLFDRDTGTVTLPSRYVLLTSFMTTGA